MLCATVYNKLNISIMNNLSHHFYLECGVKHDNLEMADVDGKKANFCCYFFTLPLILLHKGQGSN